jgi:hypothetical protein
VGYFCYFQVTAQINNHLLGENSPNLVTLSLTMPSELTTMVPTTPEWLLKRFRLSSTSLDIFSGIG